MFPGKRLHNYKYSAIPFKIKCVEKKGGKGIHQHVNSVYLMISIQRAFILLFSVFYKFSMINMLIKDIKMSLKMILPQTRIGLLRGGSG